MGVMLEERIQTLLDAGIDVDWFGDCSRDMLRGYLGNLQAHRCRLDAVEANVMLALNRLDKQTAPEARPSDNADDIRDQTGKSNAESNRTARRAELFDRWPQTSAALAAGQISSGHADLLTSIPAKYHDALETDLAQLLTTAATEAVDEFKETLRAWKDQTAKDAGEDPHQLPAISGHVEPLTGAAFTHTGAAWGKHETPRLCRTRFRGRGRRHSGC